MEEEVERVRQREKKWMESLQRVKKLGVKKERANELQEKMAANIETTNDKIIQEKKSRKKSGGNKQCRKGDPV